MFTPLVFLVIPYCKSKWDKVQLRWTHGIKGAAAGSCAILSGGFTTESEAATPTRNKLLPQRDRSL